MNHPIVSSWFVALLLLGGLPALTEQRALKLHETVTKTLELDYLLHVPEEYSAADASMPLILFLHGAGERGNDLELLKKHGRVDHDSWTQTYDDAAVWEWLFAQRRVSEQPGEPQGR